MSRRKQQHRQVSNRQNLDKFLRLFSATRRLGISAAPETYAQQKAHLKRIGRLQGEFDMLIGSVAVAHGLTLVTHNTRHFTDMVGLCWKIGCRSMKTGKG